MLTASGRRAVILSEGEGSHFSCPWAKAAAAGEALRDRARQENSDPSQSLRMTDRGGEEISQHLVLERADFRLANQIPFSLDRLTP
jgi:hypothetical protein